MSRKIDDHIVCFDGDAQIVIGKHFADFCLYFFDFFVRFG